MAVAAAENVKGVAAAPGAETKLDGKNCVVTPAGKPEMLKAMAELNVALGVVLRVRLFEAPSATVIAVAETESVNAGAGWTVSDSGMVCLVEPLTAVMVTV